MHSSARTPRLSPLPRPPTPSLASPVPSLPPCAPARAHLSCRSGSCMVSDPISRSGIRRLTLVLELVVSRLYTASFVKKSSRPCVCHGSSAWVAVGSRKAHSRGAHAGRWESKAGKACEWGVRHLAVLVMLVYVVEVERLLAAEILPAVWVLAQVCALQAAKKGAQESGQVRAEEKRCKRIRWDVARRSARSGVAMAHAPHKHRFQSFHDGRQL